MLSTDRKARWGLLEILRKFRISENSTFLKQKPNFKSLSYLRRFFPKRTQKSPRELSSFFEFQFEIWGAFPNPRERQNPYSVF
ncbi:hypothetical protein LEP1GSC165_0289 [Leptospira santarosai str. CBC523]|nr:hypothetical protein LEP1GSC165_0289 [Leptospira santarosai str. CBC523]